MLDPELITKIQVADFDHFTDLAFTPAEYIKVIYLFLTGELNTLFCKP